MSGVNWSRLGQADSSRRATASYFPEMLSTLALTPGTFDSAYYSSPEAFGMGLGCLHELCREEGLFLDLRAGSWSHTAESSGAAAKRFLAFARKEGRLVVTAPELKTE